MDKKNKLSKALEHLWNCARGYYRINKMTISAKTLKAYQSLKDAVDSWEEIERAAERNWEKLKKKLKEMGLIK